MTTARSGRRVAPLLVVVVGLLASTAPADAGSAGALGADRRSRPKTAVLDIDARRTAAPVSALLAGSNHRYPHHGYGSWDPVNGQPVEAVVQRAQQVGLSILRYPGGSQADLFDWKQAVGPVEERACQVDGRWGGRPLTATYGVSEHMLTAERMGAQTHITVPFPTETAHDAGALVEYLNARVGADPDRDGVDWAAVRAADQKRLGMPRHPYHVTRWSIGNEPFLRNQRFWMADDYDKALKQYVHGGRQRYQDQLVGRWCRRSPEVSSSTGRAGQRFEVLYPPVMPGTQTLTVDGVAWQEVDSLDNATGDEQVYTFDDDTGAIHFGDGVHGAIPSRDAPVRASYAGQHEGYAEFARAMHRVDPSIDVCSEWGSVSFVQLMARQNLRYDCVAAHPYAFLGRQWATAREAHDNQMMALEPRLGQLRELQSTVRRATSGRSYVAVTEYGAISIVEQPKVPTWSINMSDALYMASSLSGMLNTGVQWAEGGALISAGLRGWIGEGPDYTLTPAARGLEAIRSLLHGGGRVVRHQLRAPRTRALYKSSATYPSLAVSTTKDRTGALNVLLVNRDPREAIRVGVRASHFSGTRSAQAWRVLSRSISAVNTPEEPHAVRLVQGRLRLSDPDHFAVVVPAHSVMRVRVPARR